jgi:signal transduction histidine kinase
VAEREHVDVEIHGDTDFQVSARRAEALVRIASEAVTNAARHAGVSDVNVSVDRRGDRIRLAVRDAGSGFDPGLASRHTTDAHGFGLGSMRGRAAAVGGQLTIASQRDAGTEVVVIV